MMRSSIGGAIVDFKDTAGYSYVAGDATATYVGKLKKWVRHILFLRPGLFFLLDEIEAPTKSRYQWMLHAFEKMNIDGSQIVSRRRSASLSVNLACHHGLNLSQTDQFDTPYNHGIPNAYHKNKANHWHITAETAKASNATRIAAMMAVRGAEERLDIQLHNSDGWFGATAKGDFGQVEGWIRIHDTDIRPKSLKGPASAGDVNLWGRARDGQVFFV
jgi:hypothetical protein